MNQSDASRPQAVSSLEQALVDEAERRSGQLVRHLQDIVRIPSVSGDEAAIVAELAGWAGQAGLAVTQVQPDLATLRVHPAFTDPAADGYAGRHDVIATLGGRSGGKTLALFAHSDVVPVDPRTRWSHPPFSGDLADGRVYGRGAADCKGGAAVAMTAAEILRDERVELAGDLQLQFVVEEETGGNGTLAAILAGHTADAMIQLEPSGTQHVVVSNRGAQFFRVTVPGTEGGVEYQHSIISAIDKAMKIVRVTQDYSARREAAAAHPLYNGRYPTTVPLAVCRFSAGEWPSTIPGEAILEGTIECLPGEDIDQVVADFERYLRAAVAEDAWLAAHPFRFERFGLRLESAEIAADDPLVELLRAASRDAIGIDPEPVGGGGSDLRLPVRYADCPTVLYGPGGGMVHSVDEYVRVDELVKCLQVVLLTAIRFLGPAGQAGRSRMENGMK